MIRVFENPDGSVRVVVPAPQARLDGEDDATFYARVMARTVASNPELQGLSFIDMAETDLPSRSRRYAWRIKDGTVMADMAVPVPHDKRQALVDELDAADNIAKLKEVLRKVIFG